MEHARLDLVGESTVLAKALDHGSLCLVVVLAHYHVRGRELQASRMATWHALPGDALLPV